MDIGKFSAQQIRAELVRRLANKSLVGAVHLLWPVLNPGTPLDWGRGMEAICLHLEAVSRGEIKRLLINCPPAVGKSTLSQLVWPVWHWAQHPESRWVGATHDSSLSNEFNSKRLRLIQSKVYQDAFRPDWALLLGSIRVQLFRNNREGVMQSTSVGSRNVLGRHFDFVNIDDPIDTKLAFNAQTLADTEAWFREKMITRVRNIHTACFVLNMQRLGPGDLSEFWRKKWGVEAHLSLPALYVPDRDPGPTSIGWKDWRKEAGELGFPGRHTHEMLNTRREEMGNAAFASQYQQRPSADKGNLFQTEWWLRHEAGTPHPSNLDELVGSVDMAAGLSDTGDFNVAQVWGRIGDRAYLLEQVRIRGNYVDSRHAITGLAKRWPLCRHWRIETKSLGPALISDFESAGIHGVIPWDSNDPKHVRIATVAPLVEAGQVSIPSNLNVFLEEADAYPATPYDDQIDCAAIALSFLAPTLRSERRAARGELWV